VGEARSEGVVASFVADEPKPLPPTNGPCAGTACADARDVDAVQDGLELGRVAALPGGHDRGQHLLALFTSQWILVVSPPRERPSAWSSGSAERPPGGSCCWPGCRRAPAACWCARAIVESTLTSQVIPSGRVRPGLQGGDDLRPCPGPLPPPEQRIHRPPGAVAVWDVPPGRTDPHSPSDPVDELPFRPRRRPTRPRGHRQQRFQPRPLLIGQVKPPRHR
jgi:hypothetical protein